MQRIIIPLLLLSFLIPVKVLPAEFTEKDRERLIRVEVKLEESRKALQKQINSLHETTKKQIEDLKDTTQKQIEDLKDTTQKQIKDLKDTTQKQSDDLRTFLFWGFGILFGGMGLLIGFVLWDRRTALEPALKKSQILAERQNELEEKEKKLEQALKEFTKLEPRFAEILKSAGLL